MNKHTFKKYKWRINRLKKIKKHISKKKVLKTHKGKKEHKANLKGLLYHKNKSAPKYKDLSLPTPFSIINNYEATVDFFNKIILARNNKTKSYLNLVADEVSEVGVEALMYIIAIIRGTKENSYFHRIKGNFPKSGEARRVFTNSGFLEYVATNFKKSITPQTDKITIREGLSQEQVDPQIVAELCTYAQNVCNLTQSDTYPLYEMMIELIGNTCYHAYNNESKAKSQKWYFYAEEKRDTVDCVFLDTGYGIPNTINKKWKERINFLYLNRDCDFIRSALNGDFRTQTKKKNRGKGLPQISECGRNTIIKNLLIYSGKGCCRVLQNNIEKYQVEEYKNSLQGSLFSWQIIKRS